MNACFEGGGGGGGGWCGGFAQATAAATIFLVPSHGSCDGTTVFPGIMP
jgi:hypothetical protein